MRRGEDHGEFDHRTIPTFFRFQNSPSAILCFSGSKRLALAKTGLPVISMEYETPRFGFDVLKPLPTIAGKAARRERTAGMT
jgi:hypothetical protein